MSTQSNELPRQSDKPRSASLAATASVLQAALELYPADSAQVSDAVVNYEAARPELKAAMDALRAQIPEVSPSQQ